MTTISSDDEYVAFMEENGAEYIGRKDKWIYFRKKAVDGPLDTFSDIDSKTNHLDSISKMLTFVGVANLGMGIFVAKNGAGIETFSPHQHIIISTLSKRVLIFSLLFVQTGIIYKLQKGKLILDYRELYFYRRGFTK